MTYYYEHVNGTVHRKPDIVVDMGGGPSSYFSGPYIKRWWYEEAKGGVIPPADGLKSHNATLARIRAVLGED